MITLSHVVLPSASSELIGVYSSMKIIDDYLIVPSAMALFITGLIYSIFTNWGFFKHRWISFKWVTIILQMLFGTFFLNSWLNENLAILSSGSAAAFNNPVFEHNRLMTNVWGAVHSDSFSNNLLA